MQLTEEQTEMLRNYLEYGSKTIPISWEDDFDVSDMGTNLNDVFEAGISDGSAIACHFLYKLLFTDG